MFIDRSQILLKGGSGGKGCESFNKPSGSRYKRPDGGKGGKGGDVYLVSDENISDLMQFFYKKKFVANSGRHGSSNNKKGKSGSDVYLKVPPGTLVKDVKTGDIIVDLYKDCQTKKIVRGGKGGRGNFITGDKAELGELGEEKEIILELKLIADVGLIGLPNAGKSTLISKISNAKSRVGSYPFTTKSPVIGNVNIDYFNFSIADIPGLIKGAHKGKGLGDKFLKHIERTKVLAFIIDVSEDSYIDPIDAYKQLIDEITSYNMDLLNKSKVIVLNKIDKIKKDLNLKMFYNVAERDLVLSISALTGEGIDKLTAVIKKILVNLK